MVVLNHSWSIARPPWPIVQALWSFWGGVVHFPSIRGPFLGAVVHRTGAVVHRTGVAVHRVQASWSIFGQFVVHFWAPWCILRALRGPLFWRRGPSYGRRGPLLAH